MLLMNELSDGAKRWRSAEYTVTTTLISARVATAFGSDSSVHSAPACQTAARKLVSSMSCASELVATVIEDMTHQ